MSIATTALKKRMIRLVERAKRLDKYIAASFKEKDAIEDALAPMRQVYQQLIAAEKKLRPAGNSKVGRVYDKKCAACGRGFQAKTNFTKVCSKTCKGGA